MHRDGGGASRWCRGTPHKLTSAVPWCGLQPYKHYLEAGSGLGCSSSLQDVRTSLNQQLVPNLRWHMGGVGFCI